MKRSNRIRIRLAKNPKPKYAQQASYPQLNPISIVDVDEETNRVRIYGLNVAEQRKSQNERDITIEFLRLINESDCVRGLIQAAATFFQRLSGCQAVGVRLKDGDDYPYFEARGFPEEFLLVENSLCRRDAEGRILTDSAGNPALDCMCGNVISGRTDPSQPFFTEHGCFWTNCTTDLLAATSEADRQSRTRNRCNGEGYESVALIPLIVGEERLGLLQLNDLHKGKFSPETIGLWERLADQLAVALAKFRAEEALFESRADLTRAQGMAQIGSWRLDLRRNELQWSDETCRIFGIAKETRLSYEEFLVLVHPEDRELVDRVWQAALRGAPYDVEHRILTKSGVRWIREKAQLDFDSRGAVAGAFGTAQDITDPKKKETELLRLNRTLKALRDSSQAVSCASQESDFLDAVCRIVVEDCGHELVWIGFAEHDERKSVRPAAFAGFEKGYLESLNVTWADDERGRGPTGTAIRRGRPTACRNILGDPRFKPWREEALKRGFASSLALPLMDGERAFGAITVYSREPDPFSTEEVRLLSELANDLAYGIMAIRLRIAHEQGEELLLQSEERYRGLVELSPDAVFVNRDERIEYMNPAGLQLFGAASTDQIVSRSPLELFHPDYRDLVRKRIGELREGQSPPRIEEKIVRLDGGIRDVEVVASHFTDRQGPAIQVILHDITERKRAEEQLRLHLTILESTANAIVISGRDGAIQWVNPAFTQLTGYRPAEVVGQNPRVLKSGRQPPKFYKHIWKTILSGQVWQGELVNRRKDGSFYTEEMTITPIADTHNGIRHFIAVKHDVTKRKLMEDDLRSAKEAAEAANVAKDHFIANISHELRTPMNAILGMTELALDEDLPPSVREYLTTARESADMLLDLLNDILDFSRIETSQFQLEMAPFSLRHLLSLTMKTLGVQAYEKGLELICDLTDRVPDQLLGDSLRLRQVLTNLIGNAIKFTSRGEIVVSVTEEDSEERDERGMRRKSAGDGSAATGRKLKAGQKALSEVNQTGESELFLKFSVEDTGIGIAPKEQERIFAPFTQADSSMTRNYGGTGLGLSIASNLVKLMGGEIRIRSQLGRGSEFSFTVRLKRQSLTPTEAETEFDRRERLRELPILLVAENPTVRRVLQLMLFRWGMKPDTMGDVPAALAKLHEAAAAGKAYGVAVVDAAFSQNDGFTLASWLNDNPGLVGSTILLFSPCDRITHFRRCQELGIRYLEKPIFQSNLLCLILQAIGAVDPPSPFSPSTSFGVELAFVPRAKRILIVEDNLANQQLALHILKKNGHSAMVASNGLEAVERVREEDFDLVLMDIQMPVMDGYQATAAVRAMTDPGKARIPIIALTAHAMKEDKQRCLAAGMNGYLNKPIHAGKMIEIIERTANNPPAESAPESPPESQLQSLPPAAASNCVFDLQEALDRCFDREMFDQMRSYFFTQSVEVLEQIRGALARGEAEEVARAAHALRGTLVYLGAHPCMDAVECVEEMGREGNLDSAPDAIERLAIQIELLKQALAAGVEKQE